MSGTALIRMPFGPAPEGYRGPLIHLAPGALGDGGLLINTGATDAQLDSLPVWDAYQWAAMWRFALVTLTAAAMVAVSVPGFAVWPQACVAGVSLFLGLCHVVAWRSWRSRHALVVALLAPVLLPAPFTGQGRRSLGGSLVRYFNANEVAGGSDERQLRFEIAHHMRAFAEVYGTEYEAAGFESLLRAEAALQDLAALGEPIVAPRTVAPELASA